ncbi:uncharacterized protein [Dermacentor andersoni]|uniref:uncharacterized protein n=1 Tax=Dermacentor andersoni TaxID=34620 RepID=UPI002155559E|nr:uncharacterized protein LOC126546012 [Dermacentor andersoni]
MDAGPSKRAHGWDHLQGLDEASAKRPRLTLSSDTPPTAPAMAHQMDPSPSAGVPVANMHEEMEWIHHHQELCLQWAASRSRLPEGPVSSLLRQASMEEDLPPAHLGHAPFINFQMGLICERMMKERQNRTREEFDHVFSA